MNATQTLLQEIATGVNGHKENTSAHIDFEANRIGFLGVVLECGTDLNTDDQNMIKDLCHERPWLTSVLATLVLDLVATVRAEDLSGTLASYAAQNKSQGLIDGDKYAYVSTHGSVTSFHKLSPDDWTSNAWRPSDVTDVSDVVPTVDSVGRA